MLRFEHLIVEDFGPYKGRQEIRFPSGPGVMFVLGENGRGKTHLLNAFRYALLGKAYGRYERHVEDMTALCNSESAKERGHRRLQVALILTKDETRYEITRTFEATSEGRIQEQMLLQRDGDVLSQENAQAELRRIMPEQIQQFFLFDSELLQKYEDLLDVHSAAGDQLKEAIERILGVPILKNARTDSASLATQIAKELEAAARSEARTERYAEQMAALRAVIEAQEENLEELHGRIEEHEAELEQVEHDMHKSARLREVLATRNVVQERRTKIEKELLDAEESLKDVGVDAWRAVIRPALRDAIGTLDEDIRKRRDEYVRATAQMEIRRRLESLGNGRCPLCDHQITEQHRDRVLERLGAPDEDRVQRIERVIMGLEAQKAQLEDAAGDEKVRERVTEVARRVTRLKVDLSDVEAEIEECNEQLGDVAEEDLSKLQSRHRNLQAILTRLRDEQKQLQRELDENRGSNQDLATKIRKAGGPANPILQSKHELILQLQGLFSKSIDSYREQLRQAVQEEATRLFRKMAHEQDYTSLRINERYGLEIIHSSGEVVTGRSSGEEQLVALALVGALQKCAPVQGPIVIDMPFARLDPRHRRNVIRTLPLMSDQVMLLAFEGEFDADTARADLRDQLQAEKRLERVTARYTIVEDQS